MPIKINGATSGSTTITAPATGGDESIELSTALASKLDLAGGKILQIVRATDSTDRTTTSTSYVDANISVTITPQKSDSAVLLIASYVAEIQATGTVATMRVYTRIADAADNAISGAEENRSGGSGGGGSYSSGEFWQQAQTNVAYATPATTSAVTYKLRFRVPGANMTGKIVNTTATGQMYAIEVSA